MGVIVAFGAAHTSIAVGRTIVWNWRFGEIVPPFTGGAVCEEGVRVGEERRVGEWFLQYVC